MVQLQVNRGQHTGRCALCTNSDQRSVVFLPLFVFGAWFPIHLNLFHINGTNKCIRGSCAWRHDEVELMVIQIFGEE